jgi:hypothetical protein
VNPAELNRVAEIELRTSLAGCSWASRPVWVVVLDGNAYVRSAFGIRSAWYRRVQAGCRTEIKVGASVWAVRLERVTGDDLNRHISDAYQAKYAAAWPGPIKSLVGDEALATTMRLQPLGAPAQGA